MRNRRRRVLGTHGRVDRQIAVDGFPVTYTRHSPDQVAAHAYERAAITAVLRGGFVEVVEDRAFAAGALRLEEMGRWRRGRRNQPGRPGREAARRRARRSARGTGGAGGGAAAARESRRPGSGLYRDGEAIVRISRDADRLVEVWQSGGTELPQAVRLSPSGKAYVSFDWFSGSLLPLRVERRGEGWQVWLDRNP